MNTTNIVVAGLGGQGVLKVTDILAEVLFRAGFDVKKSEVHGMSQRGGSVSSEVRFGDSVASPMVPAGECDLLAVLDVSQLEVVAAAKRPGCAVVSPEDVPVDKLAHPKALNTMILGAMAAKLPQVKDRKLWLDVIGEAFPEKLRALNIDMFELGFASQTR